MKQVAHSSRKYTENPLEVYVHDTMADDAKLHDATGWEPSLEFEAGIACVCNAPAAVTIDGAYVCVEYGDAVIDDPRCLFRTNNL